MWIIQLSWYLGSLAAVIATVLSMLPHKVWWMRIWDFPRIQILLLGLVMLACGVFVAPDQQAMRTIWLVTFGLLILSVIQQIRWAVRMTPLARVEVPSADDSGVGTLRVIASNVDYTNAGRHAAMRSLVSHEPDLLALVEVDQHWASVLEGADEAEENGEGENDRFPHRLSELISDGRGMALLSRVPLHDATIRHLVLDDRPSIWATIKGSDVEGSLASDDQLIGICVLHPPPPGLEKQDKDERMSSKPRDIELQVAAQMIADSPIEHWIMIGDFNDVGWSRTTEHAKATGGLLDPRIGRGFFNTFPARRPLLRYPIDHVLVTRALRVARLERLNDIGSDHLPLLADLRVQMTEASAEK